MNPRRIGLGLALLGLAFASLAGAQGLGDTAARERAKRAREAKAKKPDAKSYSNDDLVAGRPPGYKPPADTGGAAPAEASGSESPAPSSAPADSQRDQERGYLDSISAAQAQVAAVEQRIRDLSARLNPMSTTYIFGASGSNDANEELRVRQELRAAEDELSAARQSVATAQRELSDVRAGRSPSSANH